jgi:hypothetical protein
MQRVFQKLKFFEAWTLRFKLGVTAAGGPVYLETK